MSTHTPPGCPLRNRPARAWFPANEGQPRGGRRLPVQGGSLLGRRHALLGRHRTGPRLPWIAGVLLGLLAGVTGEPGAQFPLYSVGLGGGVSGVRHEEFTGQVSRGKGIGKFSASVWWVDASWSPRGRWTVGARIHTVRVGLGEDPEIGTLSLVPAVLTGGYRFRGSTTRFQGYLAAGVGMASATFQESQSMSAWEGARGGELRLSEKNPLVFEAIAAGAVGLTKHLAAELGVTVVAMDTELLFRPIQQPGGVHAPVLGYRVDGQHVLATLGLRWWFEWW